MHRTQAQDNVNYKYTNAFPPTKIGAFSLNAFQEELCLTVLSAGLVLLFQETDNHAQLQVAIANYVQNGTFYKEAAGSFTLPNEYTLGKLDLLTRAVPDRLMGGAFAWYVAHGCDGAATPSTLQLPDLVAKPLVRLDGGNPTTYDLPTGHIAQCSYDSGSDKIWLLGTFKGYRQLPLPGIVELFTIIAAEPGEEIQNTFHTVPLENIKGQKSIPGFDFTATPNEFSLPVGRYFFTGAIGFSGASKHLAKIVFTDSQIDHGIEIIFQTVESGVPFPISRYVNIDTATTATLEVISSETFRFGSYQAGGLFPLGQTATEITIVRLDDYLHTFDSDVGNG